METGYKTLFFKPLVLVLLFLVSSCLSSFKNESLAELHFTRDHYNATIPENALIKTYVRTEEKMGIYCSDDDVVIRYKVASQQKIKFFKAEEKKVGNFWFLLVRTKTDYDVLNRERQDEYVLEVKATVTIPTDKLKDKKTKQCFVRTPFDCCCNSSRHQRPKSVVLPRCIRRDHTRRYATPFKCIEGDG